MAKKRVKVTRKWKNRQAWRSKMRAKIMAKYVTRQPVQYFKRTNYLASNIVVPAFSPAGHYVNEFTLLNVPDFTEFTNLYDAYQIKAVKWSLIPRISNADQGGGSVQLAQVHSVLDYDDGTALTSINDYVQYESYKTSRGNRIHSRYFVPAIEMAAQSAGLIVAAGQKKHQWLDTDEPKVSHRGIKFFIEGGSVDTVYDVMITYYLAFKQVK